MQNKDRIERQNVIILVMNIVIGVLCLIMVICGGRAAFNLYEDYSIPYDNQNMESAVQYGDFHRLVSMYHENIANGFEGDRAMKEYYGVAKYYEAASFYKAFTETGDTVRAEREAAKMEQALEEMGGWSILEEEINAQLGL